MKSWFSAGAVCVGMGSKLLSTDLIKEKKYDAIRDKVSAALALVAEVKNS